MWNMCNYYYLFSKCNKASPEPVNKLKKTLVIFIIQIYKLSSRELLRKKKKPKY